MPELQSIYFGKGAFTFCWSNTEEDEEDEEEDPWDYMTDNKSYPELIMKSADGWLA